MIALEIETYPSFIMTKGEQPIVQICNLFKMVVLENSLYKSKCVFNIKGVTFSDLNNSFFIG